MAPWWRWNGGAAIAVLVIVLAGCGDNSTSSDERASTGPDRAVLQGELPVGTKTYELQIPKRGARRIAMTVTLPEGWTGFDRWVLRKNGGVDRRDGVAITFWVAPAFVYGDPCRWADSVIDVDPSVDFMAGALAAQAMRNASTPRVRNVRGHRTVEIQLSVPGDIDISKCDLYKGKPYFQSWASADGSTARYHQGPGQQDLVRLVDVDGELLIVDVATWPELPPDEHDEIASVLDSMRFEVEPA